MNKNKLFFGLSIVALIIASMALIVAITRSVTAVGNPFPGGDPQPECYCGAWADGTCRPQCGSPPHYSCDCPSGSNPAEQPFQYNGDGGKNCRKTKWITYSNYSCIEHAFYSAYYVCGCKPGELTCNHKNYWDRIRTQPIKDCIWHPEI